MGKLAFCDNHNIVAILEKTQYNTDLHQIVDFLEASHIRYALTVHPTIYVSHIRQFWSTARIETTDGETKIIAKVDGKQRTISESSIRRHLKLNDKEGISTWLDDELFENLSLMGYNILPNQKFSFQKGIVTSNLGFSYEIKIASGHLVEINKVIRAYKLEIEWYTFDIDLIPFGSGSFDVIVGMDWLFKHKAKIICHEKVVRIPLRNCKTHRVIGEKPE
ncbi:synaptobrevin, longin-like domain protein [Tanacetum coccineum]|uniref:Synaptobrevin, longin-like domain protein n=1 Tax=Tanacetum coccineum TaxID=301880 RepID=A0ABQ5H832_9ASTR